MSGNCQESLKLPDSSPVTELSHHHRINVFGAVIKQIVSRSKFCVELSSDWHVLLINDFLKFKNGLI